MNRLSTFGAIILSVALAACDSSENRTSSAASTSENNARSAVEAIYSASPQEAEALVRKFAVGTWTNASRPGQMWYRFTVSETGGMTMQVALPVSDDWGEASAGELVPTSSKYQDTGERWHGFKMRLLPPSPGAGNTPFTFIVGKDGTLKYYDPDERGLPLTRGDSFPFSK